MQHTKMHISSSIKSLLGLGFLLATFLLAGCQDNGTNSTDFSNVPPAFDTTGVNATSLNNGLEYYQVADGSGPYEVSERDFVAVYYTLRLKSTGEVYDSSYKNGNDTPATFQLASTIPGFAQGMVGMKPGGKRAIIVPPELGYTNPSNPLYGKTLVYDVELDYISGN